MTEPTTTPQSAAQGAPQYDATTTSYAGRFVWHDLMTTDLPKALAFYSALFGWERKPFDMGPGGEYDMLQIGEIGIGGMMPLAASDNLRSHWIPYLFVDSVDAACAKADATGGKTCVPPTDIPNVGRFAVVEDPSGAVFSPFTSDMPGAPEPANPALGTVAWNELMTTDAEGAGAFYRGLTGWGVEEMDMGPMGVYRLFKRGDVNAAGMMQTPADEQVPPHWMLYVAVADVDASVAQAAELGGTVIVPPTDIQDWGRFAVAVDPTGAAFGMLENKRPM